MLNVGISFELIYEGEKAPPKRNKVSRHLVFNMRIGFTIKGMWVLDGNKIPDPIVSTYAGVVSRKSVWIACTYTYLNGINVFASNIYNVYLQSPSSQQEYIICCPDFGLENVENIELNHRSLYDRKSIGRNE